MTPEQFAKAKEVFIDLLDRSEDERIAIIGELEKSDAETAKEVQSLLSNHSSVTILEQRKSLNGEPNNLGFDSTGTRAWRWFDLYMLGGGMPFFAAILVALVLGSLGWWMQTVLTLRLQEARKSSIHVLLELETDLLNAWSERVKLKTEAWARSQTVIRAVSELVRISETTASDDTPKRLLASTAQQELNDELNTLSGSDQRFAVFNKAFVTIADWNRANFPSIIGRGLSNTGASKINQAMNGTTVLVLPNASADERITLDYPLDTSKRQVKVLTPIRGADNQIIAVLLIREQSFWDSFEDSLLKAHFEASGDCYLVDSDGWMVNEPRQADEMRKNPFFAEYFNPKKNRFSVRVADPGGDVLKGYVPTEPIGLWMRTKSARGAMAKSD